jgi:hypothetical protein
MKYLRKPLFKNKKQDIFYKSIILIISLAISLLFSPVAYGLINGDFELGRNGSWEEFSSNGFNLVLSTAVLEGVIPQSGQWASWLGGAEYETSILSQSILIPSTATFLYYYYWLKSSDLGCGSDSAEVRLGTNLLQSYNICKINNTNGWALEKINISAFQGQTLVLSFRVFTNNSSSNFFLDTVLISQTEKQYFIAVNSKGNGLGRISSDVGWIDYYYPNQITEMTTPLDQGSTVTIAASSKSKGIVSWDNCTSSGGTLSGNESAIATCTFGSLFSDKNITATFTTNSIDIYLPLILRKSFNRSCPGGPGSPPSLSEVALSPNSFHINSYTRLNVKFSYYEPNGDLDSGTFNWVTPSGEIENLQLPSSMAGFIYGNVDYTTYISTDAQKGTFNIPTWLVDKAGNCSNIVYVNWTQY